MSEEDLQIAVKRIDMKGKGEKERYTHFFLSDQCKEIEEKNKMGKTRDLFKKTDAKGTFHAKMGNKGQRWYRPNRKRRY